MNLISIFCIGILSPLMNFSWQEVIFPFYEAISKWADGQDDGVFRWWNGYYLWEKKWAHIGTEFYLSYFRQWRKSAFIYFCFKKCNDTMIRIWKNILILIKYWFGNILLARPTHPMEDEGRQSGIPIPPVLGRWYLIWRHKYPTRRQLRLACGSGASHAGPHLLALIGGGPTSALQSRSHGHPPLNSALIYLPPLLAVPLSARVWTKASRRPRSLFRSLVLPDNIGSHGFEFRGF